MANSGLANLRALAGAFALATASFALLIPAAAQAASQPRDAALSLTAVSDTRVVPEGAMAAVAAAQATPAPVAVPSMTDPRGAAAAPADPAGAAAASTDPAGAATALVAQVMSGITHPAQVAQAVSGAIATAGAPHAASDAAGPAHAITGASGLAAATHSAAAAQSALPQSASRGSALPQATPTHSALPQATPTHSALPRLIQALPAPSDPAVSDSPAAAQLFASISRGSALPPASPAPEVAPTLGSSGTLLPPVLSNLEVNALSRPPGSLGSLFPQTGSPGDAGVTAVADPPSMNGGSIGFPALPALWPRGLPASNALSGAAAAAFPSALATAMAGTRPPTPDWSAFGAAAAADASSALQRLVQLFLTANGDSSSGKRAGAAGDRAGAAADQPAATPSPSATAASAEAVLSGATISALNARGLQLRREQAASSAGARSHVARAASRPGLTPIREAPLSPPPAPAGGASVTSGVGLGSGTSAVALLAALALWLSQFIRGRMSLELSGWRSALLTLRLERPG